MYARHQNMTIAVAVLAAATLLAACSTAPEIDASSESDVTYDGLYPVRGIRADAAWARPGVDWPSYSQVYFEGVGIEYRAGGESGIGLSARSRRGPFEVSESQKAHLQETVDTVFREELRTRSSLELVDRPGPGTLSIRAQLLDVVSNVPPDSSTGARDRVYLSEVGEATLVLEIRDAETNAIFARVVDRRAAESMGTLHESNRVLNSAEVEILVRSWARSLRLRLDEATSL